MSNNLCALSNALLNANRHQFLNCDNYGHAFDEQMTAWLGEPFLYHHHYFDQVVVTSSVLLPGFNKRFHPSFTIKNGLIVLQGGRSNGVPKKTINRLKKQLKKSLLSLDVNVIKGFGYSK